MAKIALLGLMVNNDLRNYLQNGVNPFNVTVFSDLFKDADSSELL